eukprot:801850-Rhodomonas_salina.2
MHSTIRYFSTEQRAAVSPPSATLPVCPVGRYYAISGTDTPRMALCGMPGTGRASTSNNNVQKRVK